MKYVLTPIALIAAGPALAHGDTPIHAVSPASLVACAAVLMIAAAVILMRRRAA